MTGDFPVDLIDEGPVCVAAGDLAEDAEPARDLLTGAVDETLALRAGTTASSCSSSPSLSLPLPAVRLPWLPARPPAVVPFAPIRPLLLAAKIGSEDRGLGEFVVLLLLLADPEETVRAREGGSSRERARRRELGDAVWEKLRSLALTLPLLDTLQRRLQ